MRDWWLNLSLRERQTLSVGGVFIVLFLLYEIIWSPLSDSVSALRTRVQQNGVLLAWMEQADQHMHALTKISTTPSTASILSLVQTELKKSPFAQHVGQLRQGENNTVQMTLQKVNFDQLITWLTMLWKTNGLIATQVSIMPSAGAGIVSAEVILKRESV